MCVCVCLYVCVCVCVFEKESERNSMCVCMYERERGGETASDMINQTAQRLTINELGNQLINVCNACRFLYLLKCLFI